MGKILGGIALVAALLVWLISYLIEGPLRRQMENGMNSSLKGYSVSLREVDFHPVGFSVTLRYLVVREDADIWPLVIYDPFLFALSRHCPFMYWHIFIYII